MSQCEIAARELEARKAAEAERRERARRLALRAAEEAEHAPLPAKHPEPPNWAGVPAHERKGVLQKSENDALPPASAVDFRAPDDNVFSFFMETIAGGDRLLSSTWTGKEDDGKLW